jgi:hypothetical protein
MIAQEDVMRRRAFDFLSILFFIAIAAGCQDGTGPPASRSSPVLIIDDLANIKVVNWT